MVLEGLGWICFLEHLGQDLPEAWRGPAQGQGAQGLQRFRCPHATQGPHPGLEEGQLLLVLEEAIHQGDPFRPRVVVAELQGQLSQGQGTGDTLDPAAHFAQPLGARGSQYTEEGQLILALAGVQAVQKHVEGGVPHDPPSWVSTCTAMSSRRKGVRASNSTPSKM